MSKIKKRDYTLEQIQHNLTLFHNKITDKSLDVNFWINAERADFKPLKKTTIVKKKEIQTNIHSIKEIRQHVLNVKKEYYANKKFANITIDLDTNTIEQLNDVTKYKILKTKKILSVHIVIYMTDAFGNLDLGNKSELRVGYYIKDFRTLNFKIKNIEILMRLVADGIVFTNTLDGITYEQMLNKIEKNKNVRV